MKNNTIIVRKVGKKEFTITADKKTRKGFIDLADCKEWIGTMQAHGLFRGYIAYYESPEGPEILEPTYESPCECPIIAKFVR